MGRAPVVAPRSPVPVFAPTTAQPSCVRGVVVDHGAAVAGMQISVSDAPFSVSGDCPCERPAGFCGCREGLAMLPALPRAGLVEALQSVTSDPAGRFELCGLGGDGLRLVWGEHLDGRLAMAAPEQSPFVKPGGFLELQVLPLLPVSGVVLADQTPVPSATVLAFTTPPLFVKAFTSDARGRFDTQLPPGTSVFVVSAKGFPVQRLEQSLQPQQALVLQLHAQTELTVRALFEGKPVAGAEVAIAPELPVLTDAQGQARFSLSAAVRVQVRVTKGELLGSSAVRLVEGLPRRVDVTLQKGVHLRGAVTDEAGQPRAARVRGLPSGKPIATDEAGHFTSPGLVPSSVVYPVALAEGCADSEYRAVEVGTDDQELALKLACGESVNGVVVDAEGRPVQDATVFLDSLDHREHATTDATGQFRFHQPRGSYQLKVNHERYRSFEQPLQVPAKDVTVVLDAGGSLSGRVVDAKGAGIPGASVTVVPAVLDALLSEIEGGNTRATTDTEGRFEVVGLLAGRLVVSATADSQGTVVSDVVVLQPGQHREGLVLTLDERIDLRGTVMDEQRRPIPGASVRWDPADEKSALMGVMLDVVRGRVDSVLRYLPSPSVTDVDGHYTLRGLPVSKVKLDVRADGFAAAEQVAVRGDTVDFTLKKEGGRVRGRVVDEAGRPLTQFSIDGAACSPDDGRFEVSAYGREETITFKAPGFTQQVARVVMDQPVQELGDVVMKKGLPLRVEVRGSDGKALEGVRVAAAQSVDGDSCTTKADGRCVIEPLLEVSTSVKAVKDGYVPAQATLEPGQVGQPLTLTLSPAGGRIVGEVFALPGRPAPARSVFLSGAVSKSVMSDGEGHFTAEGLPEGPYCASIDSRALKSLEWAVPVQASPTPSPVQLGPVAGGGVVMGSRTLPGRLVLVRGGGGPLSIAELLDRSATAFCETASAAVVVTVTTGDFRVEGLPPGRWAAYLVSVTQAEDQGSLQPFVFELLPNETRSIP